MNKEKDELKENPDGDTCRSCGFFDEKVECQGIWHCPNALCIGCGGGWFRRTLDSYREYDDGSGHHTVDHDEWLNKGIIYNSQHGIDRDNFIRATDLEEKEEEDELIQREYRKIIAKYAYYKIMLAIKVVREAIFKTVDINLHGYIVVDESSFEFSDLEEE